jgi:hypothetical protein
MEFAERIRKEKEGEAKFNFLNPTNPYHAFYLHKIEAFKSGAARKDIVRARFAYTLKLRLLERRMAAAAR